MTTFTKKDTAVECYYIAGPLNETIARLQDSYDRYTKLGWVDLEIVVEMDYDNNDEIMLVGNRPLTPSELAREKVKEQRAEVRRLKAAEETSRKERKLLRELKAKYEV